MRAAHPSRANAGLLHTGDTNTHAHAATHLRGRECGARQGPGSIGRANDKQLTILAGVERALDPAATHRCGSRRT